MFVYVIDYLVIELGVYKIINFLKWVNLFIVCLKGLSDLLEIIVLVSSSIIRF